MYYENNSSSFVDLNETVGINYAIGYMNGFKAEETLTVSFLAYSVCK